MLTTEGQEGTLWGDGRVLRLPCGVVVLLYTFAKPHQTVHQKRVNFTVLYIKTQ